MTSESDDNEIVRFVPGECIDMHELPDGTVQVERNGQILSPEEAEPYIDAVHPWYANRRRTHPHSRPG